MRLRVKGRHVELSDSVRRHAESKLRKLDRRLADLAEVELELWVEANPSIAASHVAEATVWTKGTTLRAREGSPSFEASIDEVLDKLERQVKRYREKRTRRDVGLRNGASAPPEPIPVEEIEAQLRGETSA